MREAFQFRQLQSRVLFFFLGMTIVIQGAVFATVDIALRSAARAQVNRSLDEGVAAFAKLVDARGSNLSESVRILTADFAFKSAVATGDVPTIESVLQNHGSRIGADAMILLGLDQSVIAGGTGKPSPSLVDLAGRAIREGRASGVVLLDGAWFQMLIQPVLAPVPLAWTAVGFKIDDDLAKELRRFTKLEVSFVTEAGMPSARVVASSSGKATRDALERAMQAPDIKFTSIVSLDLADGENLGRILRRQDGGHLVLIGSVESELAPFYRLRLSIVLLALGGLLLSAMGAYYLSRSVTEPVRELVSTVREVGKGKLAPPKQLSRQDELGELARAIGQMTRDLADRDKVRELLGKVVSPVVAEQLLASRVELGGEERYVTVLFSDIRDFTSFSERFTPHEAVEVLNAYFTVMSEIIETHGGVIDKYIGDGLMALFGAPLEIPDSAGSAITAALEMEAALESLNAGWEAKGLPKLDIGVGINSGAVIAGNLGSPNRLNYTVVGDAVNLASRLEGLTKRPDLQTRIIVSDATLLSCKRAFITRSLGTIAVRGRQEGVVAHAVIGFAKAEQAASA